MNILILNSSKTWGGTEKWALHTALGLAALGHAVYFGCRSAEFEKRTGRTAVTFVRFPFANDCDVVTVVRLRAFIRARKIDAVMPSMRREYLLAGLAAKLGTGAKVAGMYGIDRPITTLRQRFAFRKLFDIVFVVAKKIVPILAGIPGFDPAKCRVVYVGVDPIARLPEIRERCRGELGISESEICVMAIGRLTSQKGFDHAIRALALLRDRPLKLVIAGEGDAVPLRGIARGAGVEDRVVFTGFRADVPDLLQAADLYWLTSRSEGIPNTMLEAMAAKVPVVAFDIAGVAEVVTNGKNGVLVPFENIEALAKETMRLIDDGTERARVAIAGYETVVSGFSMEKMCRDTERALVELVGRRDVP
jgi:glycosyltransferase involved in cell wall biosynthesis